MWRRRSSWTTYTAILLTPAMKTSFLAHTLGTCYPSDSSLRAALPDCAERQTIPSACARRSGRSAVEFPNLDPWFHNVFSLYKGERFDLGLYEAGSSRTVHFERAGVSFIFCNIHPEMSAYVLALGTPYFAVSDHRGNIRIADVPPGRYRIEVWFERAESPDTAKLSLR